jgi:ABC-type sugar transport system ATPase subunit
MVNSIEVKDLTLNFGSVSVLKNMNLDVAEGEFVVLLGPSGCGKSTLLNCLAGLLDITDGQIWIKEKNVTWSEPSERGIGMVFQSYALYPQMTVRGNLSFGLKNAKVPQAEIDKRIARAAEILQIQPLLDRKPAALSGGQRQRVAIGRALVRDVDVFLFDEPLSNLDAALRAQMRIELSDLHRKLGATMIYVTHDQVEAMTMADKIVVLNGGRIEQAGSPMDLYNAPVSPFVAGFIGSPKMNLYPGEAAGERCGTYGIRPEHLQLSNGSSRWTGTVRHVERLGADTVIYLDVPGLGEMVVRTDGDANPAIGSLQGVSPIEAREFRFP